MEARLRAQDWSDHVLGPMDEWPQSLRTAMGIIMGSPCAMWLGWGGELSFFCNDACASLIGDPQGWAPGMPARDVWREQWREIGPHAESTLASGRAATSHQVTGVGTGATGRTFFHSPIPDESGEIAGMMCVVTESQLPVAKAPSVTRRRRASRSVRSAPESAAKGSFAGLLEECERRHRELLEGIPAAIYTCDGQGRITSFNEAAAELWGRRPVVGVDLWSGSWRTFHRDGSPLALDECPMALALREGRTGAGEEIIIERPDGQRRTLLAHPAPLRNAAGELTGAVNLLIDVTNSRQTEAALRETEHRLRLATQTGRLGIWEWDVAANRMSWSDSLFGIHGMNPSLFDGTLEASLRLVHPDDRDRVETAVRGALAGEPCELEYRALRPDGSIAWLLTNGVFVRRDGSVRRMLGVTVDVTERRRANEAISESEQRFSRFMQHLPGLAWIKDDRGRYVFANGAAMRVFGMPAAELLGRTDLDVFPPETAAQFQRNDRVAIATGRGTQTIESLHHFEDGRLHHSIVSKFPIPSGAGRPPYVGGMAIDVTDRREAEQALQDAHDRLEQRVLERTAELEEANARFQAVFDQGLFAGLIALDGTLIDVNRSWLEASGFTRDQVLGRLFWELGWWNPSREVQAWIKIGFAEAAQGQRFHGETVYYTANGAERRVEFALMPIRNRSGELNFIVPTGIDVTDRHRAEQDLQLAEVARETDARFRRMADAAPVLIWMADANNAGTWFNHQWLDFVGRPQEMELGEGWLENVHADDVERCRNSRRAAFAAHHEFEMEFRMRRHDGEFRWMLDHGVPTFGHDGEFTGCIGSCVDITERKQAELAIQRLAAIVESSGDAILAVDLEGFVTSWNRGAEVLYGYAAVEIIGQPITMLIPPFRRGEENGFLRRVARGERIQNLETQRTRKDGSLVEVSISVSPIRDAAGEIVGASKIARDITERKRTEAELRRREQLYRAIGESIEYGIWVCDAAGRNTYASDSFRRLVGTDQEEFLGLEWTKILHPDDKVATETAWLDCVSKGTRWEREFRVRGVDGRWHPILARGVPVRDERGEITSWVGINLDISRLKQNEEALREQTRRLAILNRVGNVLAAELEFESVVHVVTEAGREVCGAALGAFFCATLSGEDRCRLLAQTGVAADPFETFGVPRDSPLTGWPFRGEGVVRVGDVQCDPRYRRMHLRRGVPAGQLAVRSYLAVPVISRSGAVHGGLFFGHPEPDVFTADAEQLIEAIAAQAAIAIDNAQLYREVQRELSEHLRAENALRESEERFRTLADNIAQFAWMADAQGGVIWFNRRWFDYTASTLEATEGWGWRSLLRPEDIERVSDKYAGCIKEGAVWEDTFPLRRHDGVYRWYLTRAVPIRDQDDRVVRWFGTSTDITELREVEQQLERARDEAVAASRAKDDFLAALSHELRTPLNPVLLLASDASEDLTLSPEVRADFSTIRKHVSLEARLIDDLLDLTRISRGKLSLEFAEHDVHAVLRDALATVAGEIQEKPVTLTLQFDADAPCVRADAVRLQQVFWNILKNAVKFTPAGGQMSLSTRTVPDAGTVEITVTDTGIGISEAELPRIFDAFSQGDHAIGTDTHRFGGLGLGLAISRMVVELHGGSISATSRGVGCGASFKITLPAIVEPVRAPAALSEAPRAAREGTLRGGRILLVEDHAPTRTALERLLMRRDFVVTPAGTLSEARALARASQFDLLISDIGLPDGSGCDLMRECVAERLMPGIALTGYGMDQDVARSRAAGFAAHLTKPISVQALDRALSDALPGGVSSSPSSS